MEATTTLDNLAMIEESASQFAEAHIRPHFMEWDEAQLFPINTMRNLGHHGFLGVLVYALPDVSAHH